MISKSQQKQIEKYVKEFQALIQEGNDPKRLISLIPEFYHFIGGCKRQVEKEFKLAQDLSDDEVKAAEGLVKNLDQLQTSLFETAGQLGIPLEDVAHAVTVDPQTQEIRINFELCPDHTLKNTFIHALRDILDVEAPLAHADYTIEVEPDYSISIRLTQRRE